MRYIIRKNFYLKIANESAKRIKTFDLNEKRKDIQISSFWENPNWQSEKTHQEKQRVKRRSSSKLECICRIVYKNFVDI